MAERIIIRQDSEFRTEFLAPESEEGDGGDFQPVTEIHALTPYGMLLAGLGSCTAIVLHTYAGNHGLKLHAVELRLAYDRVFQEDCQNCETIDQYIEQIEEQIVLEGDLNQDERARLYRVSRQCPIHKMIENGIQVQSRLIEESN